MKSRVETAGTPVKVVIINELRLITECLDDCEYDAPSIQIKKAVKDGKEAIDRLYLLLEDNA